ncbi:MAG: putative MATE family efflux protein [Neolewinella sp.]|jgi:putative MATE family efflux protein|nr:MATE family efflux transporter [Lewinella sp.]
MAAQRLFLLNGPLPKVMRTLALPAIAAMLLYGLNAFMDTVFVGQLMNEAALAGIALAYPLVGLTMGLANLVGTGAANLLSIAIGEEDEETQARILPNVNLIVLITSLLFAVPSYFFAPQMVALMGGDGEVLFYGVTYFRATLWAAPFWTYGLSLNFIIRGEGRMNVAARMMAYGLGLNLILTPIFIKYLDMGIAGAAWASNIGMLFYCIAEVRYFRSGKASFRSDVVSIAYHPEVFKRILKLGLPGFILGIMGLIQAMVVFNAIVGVSPDGERDLAFFAAANRIMLLLMTPLFGLMRALQPIAGVNYGAGQMDRAKAAYWLFVRTGFFLVLPFWIFMNAFPELSLRLVLPDFVFTDQDIVFFRLYMFILPLLPLVFNALTWLPAINRPKYASYVGVARQLVFFVPVMLILPHYFGLNGVYYGAVGIDVVVTIWLVYLVRRAMRNMGGDAGAVNG